MNFDLLLFDLGNTLIHSPASWPPVFTRANRAMLDSLHRDGVSIPAEAFLTQIQEHLDRYYAEREVDHLERTWLASLKDFLKVRGFGGVSQEVLRRALDAMFSITQTNWVAETDSIPTLSILKNAGYRLGMVSNASDDRNVMQLVERDGFLPYFDFIVTSAACGMRKPRPEIFRLALDHAYVPAERVAMIGDTKKADIEGANRLGIFSIWIRRRAVQLDPAIVPGAVVETLSEIPSLLAGMADK
ncbi:MAG: HAD family hydrolase [Chloroflexi bacterium]|nr:HAD family hydrolase [Chloroflexota bacterium]